MGFGDAIVSAVSDILGIGESGDSTPGWQKRLKESAYTSPGGTRQVFQYVDLKRTINKRTARFQFNGLNGAYIQDNGHDEGVYPIVAFFTGDDQDKLGTAFEGLLTETGRGKLEHPMYGTIDVVPTGSISRQNLMVSAANQTAIQVTFSSTLAEVYPKLNLFPKNTITQTIKGFDIAAAAQFANDVDLSDPVAQSVMANAVGGFLIDSAQTIRQISGGLASAQRAYDNQARKITESIDTLINAPSNLAGQLIELIRSPADTLIDFRNKVAGYNAFADSRSAKFAKVKSQNAVALENLLMSCATSAAVQGGNFQTFKNRPDALAAAVEVSAMNEKVSESLDELFVNTEFLDEGTGYQINQESVSQLTGKLVSDSFDLLPERIIYLESARSTIDVCAQVYGSLDDDKLQLFLDTNQIGSDEFYVLERGRRISYYA